jgi:4-amino-4-deoxy-L-arabinose transferase-like glycosyltransferase
LRWRGLDRTTRLQRLSLVALLALTAVLYLWDVGASGYANSFYSAAVQAATKSWNAFFFGSFDSSNFITVDKPPASLWVMDLSARIFGVNSWSILAPQALEGVAAVGLLYGTVRRAFGHGAGLIAGAVLAVTPVAALMFRFNNPDALLVLLLVGAAYATVRAVASGRTGWLVLAGTLVGFGFLSKMLQAFLVLPAFALVYLVAGPTPVRRRIVQLVGALSAVVVSAGWWVAVVTLWPAADRPYIGGSTDNSVLNLIFGYNGFGRITGNETGSVGGFGGPGGWGPTGVTRLFNSSFGGQISWLLPAALLFALAVFVLRRRHPRTDLRRAVTLLFGGWLLVTAVVFSFALGIIHPYYTVALAPAIAALVGGGAVTVWSHRHSLWARLLMAVTMATTAVWAAVLLDRSPTWLPWLRTVILVGGLAAAVLILAANRLRGRLLVACAALALSASFAGPLAYSIDTAATAHGGAIPSAGPAVVGGLAGPGGRGGPGAGGPGGRGGLAGPGGRGFGRGLAGGPPGFAPPGGAFPGGFANGFPGTAGGGPAVGGAGGLLGASTPSAAVVQALQSNAGQYAWVAATVGANNAAGYQLGSGDPVMAIGGFNGTDSTPTLAQFQQLVADHQIHYFIAGRGLGGGASTTSAQISAWVTATFTPTQIGGTTLYDLTVTNG